MIYSVCFNSLTALDFIIDDSGSMQSFTDSYHMVNGRRGKQMTRWEEVCFRLSNNQAFERMKSLVEIISHIPIQTIRIKFLTRTDKVVVQRRGGSETPEIFQQNINSQLDAIQRNQPRAGTPVYVNLESALNDARGKRHRYAFHS
jgi:hypothetical protein